MKYFKTLIAAALLTVVAWFAAGCSDSKGENKEDPTPPSELKLLASPSVVNIGETVSLKVMLGEEDVTGEARLFDALTEKDLDASFVPNQSDVYRVVATYDGKQSDPVTVTVVGTFEGTEEFFRRVLLLQFTATTCVNCPSMSLAIKQLDNMIPNRMTAMGLHVADEFSIKESGLLASDFKIKATPWGNLDYHQEIPGPSEVTSAATMKRRIETEMETYPAESGIALDSQVENGQIKVKARFRFAKADDYLVCCAILEDEVPAVGAYEPTYDHMLRQFATARWGDKLGTRKAGEEYPCVYTFEVGQDWNLEKCRVVAYTLKLDKEGNLYINNVAECAVGEKVDFAYEAK